MNWFEPLDFYCERTEPGLLAEPINLISNLTFILVAVFLYQWARAQNKLDRVNIILIGLIGLVGFGSSIFHAFATRGTVFIDIVPIWTFVLYYVYSAMRSFFHMSRFRAARSMVFVLAIFAITIYLVPENFWSSTAPLNGSEQYIPALIAFVVFATSLQAIGHSAAKQVWIALGVFVLGLLFRTIDNGLCGQWPSGTHVGWHILTALMFYLLLAAKIQHGTLAGKTRNAG